MKRKIYDKLLEWKEQSQGKTALLIEGARRVGKSYIVEKFAENEYESFILIDFNKEGDEIRGLFDQGFHDPETFFLYLSAYYGVTLKERKSLIVLDEVQLCPRARAMIKYFVADGRYDYIETGSLISIQENTKDIVIPSEEEHLQMNPMDFEEFLWAFGMDKIMPAVRNAFEKEMPLGPALHRKILSQFRLYLIVGGMPQAVQCYVDTNDFNKVDRVKRNILSLYRSDIDKYAEVYKMKVRNVFDEIPSQLQKHDRKFRMTSLKKSARMRDYEDSFLWLNDARIVNLCYNSTEPSLGLKMNEDRTTLKCYMADTGLLLTMTFDENRIMSEEIYKKILFGKLEVNLGNIMENAVAQMLTAAGHHLYFYNNPDRMDAESRMELDFLVAKPAITNRHNIRLIEVKSSADFTLVSLKKAVKKYNAMVDRTYVLYMEDVKKKDGITYLPLYMAGLL